jgi:hypothetical protein
MAASILTRTAEDKAPPVEANDQHPQAGLISTPVETEFLTRIITTMMSTNAPVRVLPDPLPQSTKNGRAHVPKDRDTQTLNQVRQDTDLLLQPVVMALHVLHEDLIHHFAPLATTMLTKCWRIVGMT